MDFTDQSINSKLLLYKDRLELALENESVQAALDAFNYTSPVVENINGIYKTVYNLHINRQKEYGEQYGATEQYNEAKEKALKYYMKLVKLGRIIYKNNTTRLSDLLLLGGRAKIYKDFYFQMAQFYERSLASRN